MNILENSILFLEKTKLDQTSNIGKIRFLREKNVDEKIIQKAFEKIFPEINIKQLMQYTDSFPNKETYSYVDSTKNWGLGTIGFLSVISGVITYLGAWSSRESELESSRCAHTLELEQYRLTIELKQEKIKNEREKEKKQVQDIVKLLSKQSEDVRRTMNVLQDSLKILQFASDDTSGKNSAPVINHMLSNDNVSKPPWMYEKIKKTKKKKTLKIRENKTFKSILETYKEEKLKEINKNIKFLANQSKKENFLRTVSIMLLYLKNIRENPNELRYRGLNTSNERYRKTVFILPGAEQVLKAVGFEKNKEKLILPLYDEESHEFLTQIDILNETKSKLENMIKKTKEKKKTF